jgi:hypothetical protein
VVFPAYVLFSNAGGICVVFPAGYGDALGLRLGYTRAVSVGSEVLDEHEVLDETEGGEGFDNTPTVVGETTHIPFVLSQNGALLGLQQTESALHPSIVQVVAYTNTPLPLRLHRCMPHYYNPDTSVSSYISGRGGSIRWRR